MSRAARPECGAREIEPWKHGIARLEGSAFLDQRVQPLTAPGEDGDLRRAGVLDQLDRGGSLKEVADVLRHRSLNTSLIYAKLDQPRLAAVALPWPGSAS